MALPLLKVSNSQCANVLMMWFSGYPVLYEYDSPSLLCSLMMCAKLLTPVFSVIWCEPGASVMWTRTGALTWSMQNVASGAIPSLTRCSLLYSYQPLYTTQMSFGGLDNSSLGLKFNVWNFRKENEVIFAVQHVGVLPMLHTYSCGLSHFSCKYGASCQISDH